MDMLVYLHAEFWVSTKVPTRQRGSMCAPGEAEQPVEQCTSQLVMKFTMLAVWQCLLFAAARPASHSLGCSVWDRSCSTEAWGLATP